MEQIAIIYNKETKEFIASIKFNDIITDCNILKIPGIEVVITTYVSGLVYVKDNKYYVNEELLFKR